MSNFLGESDLIGETEDTRNQFHNSKSDKFSKMGFNGLNMAKKSNNFKEMKKANERMMEKRKEARRVKMRAKAERREESKQNEYKITSKEQIRKENRRSARLERQMNK